MISTSPHSAKDVSLKLSLFSPQTWQNTEFSPSIDSEAKNLSIDAEIDRASGKVKMGTKSRASEEQWHELQKRDVRIWMACIFCPGGEFNDSSSRTTHRISNTSYWQLNLKSG